MNDLLIVDDEQPVLQSLAGALDWAEYGFAHVHTAGDPETAIRLMAEHEIDLLLLDIQMPGMSGLELLMLVRSRYPGIHCILISAHSKFEYAREALTLNVENYLLKPIDTQELRETVAHAAENINRAAADSRDLFTRNLLERWLYGRISTDELLEHSRYTELNVLLRRYFALVISLDRDAKVVLRRLASELPPEYPTYSLVQDVHQGILLVGGQDITADYLRAAAAPLTEAYPDIRIVCGLAATGSSDVARSLADALHTLSYARLSGANGFLSYGDVDWNLLSPTQLSALSDLLQLPPEDKKLTAFALSLAKETGAESAHDLRGLYAQICLALLSMVEEPEGQLPTLPALDPPFTPAHFAEAIGRAVTSLGISRTAKADQLTPIIRRVIAYVRDNMTGSISIKQFCEQTGMNPTYIGRLFKEEIGMYFSDYVCFLRISKAKMLLTTTDLSVGDIARQVGMYDVSYFVRCFKKQERTSPMKYRQAMAGKKEAYHEP